MSLNPWQLDRYSQPIVDHYIDVEQQIIEYIIDSMTVKANQDDIDGDDYAVQNYATGLVKYAKEMKSQVHAGIKQAGQDNIDPLDSWLKEHNGQVVKKSGDLVKQHLANTDSYLKLASRNMSKNAVDGIRNIITSATNEYRLGKVTKKQAVGKALHQWSDNGIPALIDQAGKQWSPETYVRTVVQTQANRLANEETLQRIKDNGQYVDISAHIGARPLCAPYQGKRYSMLDNDPKYPSFYSTSYGKAAGILGINCHHHLMPVANDGAVYNPSNIDDDLNAKVYKQTQQQRKYEREIRKLKNHVRIADNLDDEVGKTHYQARLRDKQAQLRQFQKSTGLRRRSELESNLLKPSRNDHNRAIEAIAKHERTLAELHAEYGKHGLPKTVDEYRKVLYNKRNNQALHAYLSARKRGVIEPVYSYKDYQAKFIELDNRLIGLKTFSGVEIKGLSNHTIDRALGALHDASHRDNKRIPVSTEAIVEALINGKLKELKIVTYFETKRVRVVVSKDGNIISVVPKGES
ncbi:phage minor capsid protein [Pediococcus acidilactici]